jgi:hypothetical protein
MELDGELAQRFLKVKHAKGLHQNTEVVRVIVTEAADRIAERT